MAVQRVLRPVRGLVERHRLAIDTDGQRAAGDDRAPHAAAAAACSRRPRSLDVDPLHLLEQPGPPPTLTLNAR